MTTRAVPTSSRCDSSSSTTRPIDVAHRTRVDRTEGARSVVQTGGREMDMKARRRDRNVVSARLPSTHSDG